MYGLAAQQFKETYLSLRPIVSSIGSKQRVAKKIIALFPKNINSVIEVFGGSGAITMRAPLAKLNVINDANKDLIGIYKMFRNTDCKTLERRGEQLQPCEKKPMCKRKLRKEIHGKGKRGRLSPMEYYVYRMFSFSGDESGGTGKRTDTPASTKLLHCTIFQRKLKKIKLENLDYKKAFKKYDKKDSLVFMDPPYDIPSAKDYYKQTVDPKEVCELARNANGKVLITYNDNANVRCACRGLYYKAMEYTYSSADSADHKGKKPRAKELVIANYPLPGKKKLKCRRNKSKIR